MSVDEIYEKLDDLQSVVNALHSVASDYVSKCADYEKEVGILKTLVDEKNGELAKAERKNEDFLKKLDEQNKAIDLTDKKLHKVYNTILEFKDKTSQADKENKSLKEDKSKLEGENQKLRDELSNKEKEMKSLQDRLKALEAKVESIDKMPITSEADNEETEQECVEVDKTEAEPMRDEEAKDELAEVKPSEADKDCNNEAAKAMESIMGRV